MRLDKGQPVGTDAWAWNITNFFFEKDSYFDCRLLIGQENVADAVKNIGNEFLNKAPQKFRHFAIYDLPMKIERLGRDLRRELSSFDKLYARRYAIAKLCKNVAYVSYIAAAVFAVALATGLITLSLPAIAAISAALIATAILGTKNSRYNGWAVSTEVGRKKTASQTATENLKNKIIAETPNYNKRDIEIAFRNTQASIAKYVHKYNSCLELLTSKNIEEDLAILKELLDCELFEMNKEFQIPIDITKLTEDLLDRIILFNRDETLTSFQEITASLDINMEVFPRRELKWHGMEGLGRENVDAVFKGTQMHLFIEMLELITKLQLQINKFQSIPVPIRGEQLRSQLRSEISEIEATIISFVQ